MLRTRKTAKVITAPRSKLPLFFCFGVGFVKRQHVLFSLWIFVIWIEREREMLWVSSGAKWLSLQARKESILLSLYNFYFFEMTVHESKELIDRECFAFDKQIWKWRGQLCFCWRLLSICFCFLYLFCFALVLSLVSGMEAEIWSGNLECARLGLLIVILYLSLLTLFVNFIK